MIGVKKEAREPETSILRFIELVNERKCIIWLFNNKNDKIFKVFKFCFRLEKIPVLKNGIFLFRGISLPA